MTCSHLHLSHKFCLTSLSAVDSFYRFDTHQQTWMSIPHQNETPSARMYGGLVSADGRLFLFGGEDERAALTQDMIVFDALDEKWTLLHDGALQDQAPSPIPRSRHGFASAAGRLYVYGGQNYRTILGDMWEFSPIILQWTELNTENFPGIVASLPTARESHGFTECAGRLYLYGGKTNSI